MHQDAAPDHRPVDRIDGRASTNLSAFKRNRMTGQAGLREASRNFGRCLRNHRATHEPTQVNVPRRELSNHLILAVILRARIVRGFHSVSRKRSRQQRVSIGFSLRRTLRVFPL
jgi:hypothetical protein